MISEGIETNHSLKTPRKYMKKPHSQVYFQNLIQANLLLTTTNYEIEDFARTALHIRLSLKTVSKRPFPTIVTIFINEN